MNYKICGTKDILNVSDHHLVYCIFKNWENKTEEKLVKFRNLKRIDHELLRDLLLLTPFQDIYQMNDINHKIEYFNRLLTELFDTTAPEKDIRVRTSKQPWYTDNVKLIISLRDKALQIQQAINTAKHQVTGFSPSFLNFACYAPLSGKYYGEIQSTKDLSLLPGDRQGYISDFSGLSEVFSEVKQKLHQAYEKNVVGYNLRKRNLAIKYGEEIKYCRTLRINFPPNSHQSTFFCIVRKKISNIIYELENPDKSKAGIWHVKDLKSYLGSNSDVSIG
ncbi:hypothetical protein NQ317_016814 [Molorchus minor]|uniref:GIY-YIG homing endonuclease n=1 Tax=Molorchus minor TaxID=1323400 RepID=A0ABQ9JHI1_9CUCU|nr:hypothetical protein NQ317_016814 [Molorchus minor]